MRCGRKHQNVNKAALEIDAILHFIRKRYEKSVSPNANIGKFLIKGIEVDFTSEVHSPQLRRLYEQQILVIRHPPVKESEESKRRIEVLNDFSESLIRAQGEAIRQLRKMLVPLLDDEAYELMITIYKQNMDMKEIE